MMERIRPAFHLYPTEQFSRFGLGKFEPPALPPVRSDIDDGKLSRQLQECDFDPVGGVMYSSLTDSNQWALSGPLTVHERIWPSDLHSRQRKERYQCGSN